MTDAPHPNDLQMIAAALAARNAKNKRKIQNFRRDLALDKANRSNIPHPGKFPTKYKYG